MAETCATAGLDRARYMFSGPPLPSGADPGAGGVSASSREAARAALLQLREAVSSADFQDCVDGVVNASASIVAKEETASGRSEESSASDDKEDMDSSLTDGSREA